MSSTLSTGSFRSEINVGDVLVGADRGLIAFGDQPALVHDGDTIGKLEGDIHVVFDHHDGHVAR